MRSITSKVYAALKSAPVHPVVLVEIDHPDGYLYLWSGTAPLSYGGNTYDGAGLVAGISVAETSSQLRIWDAQMFLSAVPTDELEIIDAAIRNRKASIFIAFLNAEGNVIPDPVPLFEITMDNQAISVGEDGSHTIIINGQLGLWQLERVLSVSWTKEEQDPVYTGDTGFDLIPTLADKEVTWTRT